MQTVQNAWEGAGSIAPVLPNTSRAFGVNPVAPTD